MIDPTLGFCLLLIAAIGSASFTVPMKFNRNWAWENTWLVWSVLALVALPLLITIRTIPHIGEVYRQIGLSPVLIAAALGLGWGVAQVLFGLAVESIGIALAFSIVPGMSVAIGSLVPLFFLHPERVLSKSGIVVIAGVALALMGVIVCAIAGGRKHGLQTPGSAPDKSSFKKGLFIAICSGSGAAMVNLGLAFGAPLIKIATDHGADPVWAPNIIWLPVMLSGSIPNVLYCLHLMRRNKTAVRFQEPGRSASLARTVVMAIVWFAGISLYGVASGLMGSWGAIIGWPLFMTTVIVTAGIMGFATGEWKNTGNRPFRIQISGMAVLIVAIFILWGASRGAS